MSSESEMIGQPLTILLPKFQLPEHLSGGELIGRRKDGTEFPAEVAFGVVSGDQSMFTGFVQDISERKRAEEGCERPLQKLKN
jgi:PAS domain S-box-containing protein